jgi:hypothetical protein
MGGKSKISFFRSSLRSFDSPLIGFRRISLHNTTGKGPKKGQIGLEN